MFANPEVSAFIDRLIGGQTPSGGAPPSAQGYRTSLARGLLGDITKPSSAAVAPAPPIQTSRRPIATPAQSVGVNRGIGSQEQQGVPNSAREIGIGSSGLTTGIENIGRGIEGGLDQLAANKQAADKIAALHQGDAFPEYDTVGLGSPSTASLPTFARPGIGTGPVGASIGGVEGLPQFLNGIKAGEGVPYSGKSSTGAIGAYGLTGDFIKQYAPSSGLPTDRASYMNNPALQDKLAASAATQMYNKFGSWPSVANAWLTGSPTATTSAPGNMSPSAYVAKVMRAANMSGADQIQDQQQDAAPTPGQGNPHMPGFDPSSVSFTNTPIGKQGMLLPPVDPLALALAGGQMPAIDPNFGGSLSGLFG